MGYKSKVVSKNLNIFVCQYSSKPLLNMLCKKFPNNTITKMTKDYIYHNKILPPELLSYLDGFGTALGIALTTKTIRRPNIEITKEGDTADILFDISFDNLMEMG